MPTTDDILEQLDRVVASETFSNTGRHRRLLQYLVGRTLAGEGDRLKEYVIATEVFDRPDSYDPRLDSIVRVEVRRLRTRLESYYRGPGAADAVVISIPRGSYAPEFSVREALRAALESAQPVEPTTSDRRPWLLVTLVGAVVAVLFATRGLQPVPTVSAGPAALPGIAVLPFEPYSSIPDHRLLAAQLTDAVTAELARLGTVGVASRASTVQYAGPRRISELAAALDVQYVIEASSVVQNGQVRVVARLVDAGLDRKIWVRVYESKPVEAVTLASRVAAEAATFMVAYHHKENVPEP